MDYLIPPVCTASAGGADAWKLTLPLTYSSISRPHATRFSGLSDLARLQAELEVTPASSILQPPLTQRTLITVPASATLSSALATLTKHRLLSAPVMTDDGSACLGCIDALAILDCVMHLQRAHERTMGESDGALTATWCSTPLSALLSRERKEREPALSVSPTAPLVPFFTDNPVLLLVDLFASGVHRVALISASYEIRAICSQSDLLQLLHRLLSDVHHLPELQSASMAELVPHSNVWAVSEGATVHKAIQTLLRKGLSTLAVVHSVSGALMADVSPSAFASLTDVSALSSNLVDFLDRHAATALEPVCVHPEDSLRRVVAELSRTRKHCAWIVDEKRRPQGVLTLTDLCRLLGTSRHVTSLQVNGDVSQADLWTIKKPAMQ